MLEKPNLSDARIVACLQEKFAIAEAQVTFLPLGSDLNTAVYRVNAADEKQYFLKLRQGQFDETSVRLPKLLSDRGITQIIAPLLTKRDELWGELDSFKVILYPLIEGKNGYETKLTKSHWRELGTALKRIHAAKLPAAIMQNMRRERYAPQAREIVKKFLTRPRDEYFVDVVAQEMMAVLRQQKLQILDLIARAEQLAQKLQIQPPELVVCHSDLHAGNIFIANDGALYIVDWDEPILAPKERDLMYIGGGLLDSGLKPRKEEKRFYKTYGSVSIDANALAYYRYERIIQDIAVYCKQLLLSDEGGADRAQSLHYLKTNFLPQRTIEIAYKSDKTISMK